MPHPLRPFIGLLDAPLDTEAAAGPAPSHGTGLPAVSVIMPIRNEARFIERSLGAVLAQDYPQELLEVLVADGMSTDRTREIVARLTELHPGIRVVVVDNPGRIVPTGFNHALAQARGAVIVRVDGHTVIASDYVMQCVATLQRTRADNVGGRMDAVAQGYFGKAVAFATSTPFGVGGARFHYSEREEEVDTVYMGAWPRRVFETVGRFDEEQVRNQDDEFNYRLLKAGGRILLSQTIRSTYYSRSTPRTLWRQYFDYGYWKVRVMQKHPRQMRLRQFVPAAFVAALLALALLAPFTPVASWGLAAVAGSYAAANLLASAATARRVGWRWLPALGLAFAILHLSYGAGFLAGLIRFSDRWSIRGSVLRSSHQAAD